LATNRRLLSPLTTIHTSRGIQHFLVTHWLAKAIRGEHRVWMSIRSIHGEYRRRVQAKSTGEEWIDEIEMPKLQGGQGSARRYTTKG
jgi:hypothetical protein